MKKVLFVAACLMFGYGAYAQDRKIAVFDPDGKSVSDGMKAIVREEISSVLVSTRGYIVLERQLINKVLEESKFQMGGLVDDSQIGEIGKKMGADVVFVTSITPIGRNLFLSFKLIDVKTARIEGQKTAKTEHGEEDADVVARRVVSEMFAQMRNTSQGTAPQGNSQLGGTTTDALLADGVSVFQNGRKLKPIEIKALMTNTEALRLYDKGLSRRKTGSALMWTGIGIILAGGVIGVREEEAGVAVVMLGLAGSITGICLRVSGKNKINDAVDVYNNRRYASNYKQELRFGFTGNGVGLALNF
ncbi:hypothetical protein AGMMS4956_05650 [Bacteroidia bacterium]|nr:hypothetical protein AGMMS4956_05650 [Bacteroidia bacterium]